ncbi:MAG TPA: cytochrome o ubiquinol oxidase subunit IV [Burkholderiaceae bacterium]
MDRNATTGELRSYAVGLALAMLLTAVPFALVAWGALDRSAVLIVIAITALLQAGVHLRFFLGIGARGTPRDNLLALAFAAVLIVIMIGGSLWIMMNLHQRMMVMPH